MIEAIKAVTATEFWFFYAGLATGVGSALVGIGLDELFALRQRRKQQTPGLPSLARVQACCRVSVLDIPAKVMKVKPKTATRVAKKPALKTLSQSRRIAK